MKLSKLRCLCDKAIEKYGDINVGTYSKDYAYDIEQEADLHGFTTITSIVIFVSCK